MVNYFDAQALFALSAVFSLLICVVMFAIARGSANVLQGMYSFASAYAAYTAFAVLLLTRPVIPEFFSVVMADWLLSLGLLLVYDGLGKLYRRNSSHRLYVIYLALSFVGYLLFTYPIPSYYGRMLVVSVSITLMFGLTMRLLWLKGVANWRLGEWMLTIALLASIFAVLLRDWHGMIFNMLAEHNSVFAYQGVQAAYLAINILAVVFIALALIILSQDRLRQDLEHLASHDSLTGVLTRRVILEVLEKSLAGVSRGGQPLAIMLVDLDHFKRINDCYGHRAGDQVLVRIVSAIRSELRKAAHIGRYGGEEFLIVMPETNENQLQEAAERIRRVAACTPVSYEQHILHCTVSIGGLKLDKHNLSTMKDPLASVDAALYEAKAQGRNRVVLHGCDGLNTAAEAPV